MVFCHYGHISGMTRAMDPTIGSEFMAAFQAPRRRRLECLGYPAEMGAAW